MMAEAGAPILTGLFLEMNAGALALMGAGWLLHELTVAWDVKYTISRRKIFTRRHDGHISGLPHAEELWRCYRAQQKGRAGLDIPKCAETLYGT